VDTVVILAAGKGRRMHESGALVEKALVKAYGKELICYAIDGSLSISARKIIIVLGEDSRVEAFVRETYSAKISSFSFIYDLKQIGRLNTFSLTSSIVGYPFLVMDCDIMFKKHSLMTFTEICFEKHKKDRNIFAFTIGIQNQTSLISPFLSVKENGDIVDLINYEDMPQYRRIPGEVLIPGGIIFFYFKNPFELCGNLLSMNIGSHNYLFRQLILNKKVQYAPIDYLLNVNDMSDILTAEETILSDNKNCFSDWS